MDGWRRGARESRSALVAGQTQPLRDSLAQSGKPGGEEGVGMMVVGMKRAMLPHLLPKEPSKPAGVQCRRAAGRPQRDAQGRDSQLPGCREREAAAGAHSEHPHRGADRLGKGMGDGTGWWESPRAADPTAPAADPTAPAPVRRTGAGASSTARFGGGFAPGLPRQETAKKH